MWEAHERPGVWHEAHEGWDGRPPGARLIAWNRHCPRPSEMKSHPSDGVASVLLPWPPARVGGHACDGASMASLMHARGCCPGRPPRVRRAAEAEPPPTKR